MKKRFLISGGGTGGHIFPAIAIASKLKKEVPDAEILFIGAKNKMEMKRVPEAGYPIVGLEIYGISRSLSFRNLLKNIKLPFVLLKSLRLAKKTIREFKPDVAIGVGGFASGPALNSAIALGVPAIIQEQNSFPGVTNKILSKKVRKICVAYDGLEQFFPAEKIVYTGNPVRAEILNMQKKTDEAFQFFGFTPSKKTLLVVGGSLGARTMNNCMAAHLDELDKMDVQVIWQTGESFYKTIPAELLAKQNDRIKIVPFIKNMDMAYSVADLIVSRAGALAISELAIIGAATILVPFPFAAEDHQTKNAAALADKQAAHLIADKDAPEQLFPKIVALLNDDEERNSLSNNILQFAKPQAIDNIVKEILAL